jgi:hypothetical protein
LKRQRRSLAGSSKACSVRRNRETNLSFGADFLCREAKIGFTIFRYKFEQFFYHFEQILRFYREEKVL